MADSFIDEKKSDTVEKNLKTNTTHKWEKITHPMTFRALFNCTVNFMIAIPTVAFHLPVIMCVTTIINLMPFSTSLRRSLQRSVKVYTESVGSTILSLWFKDAFYVSIDSRLSKLIKELEDKGEFPKILTIGNHISELDWLFMSTLAEIFNFYRYTYIIMKDGLADVPVIGHLAKSFGHMFVVRDKNKKAGGKSADMVTVKGFANDMSGDFEESRKTNSPALSWVLEKVYYLFFKLGIVPKEPGTNGLYFPEGTTFSKETYDKMQEFYAKNHAEKSAESAEFFKPDYVLLPKPAGTALLLAKLSEYLQCICDVTLLTHPYVSSTYDSISWSDIFLCKAPAFSFCMILDYLEIPEEIKRSAEKLQTNEDALLKPESLNEEEKLLKKQNADMLYKIFRKKDNVIREYVEGESKGNFKNIEEFDRFVKKIDGSESKIERVCVPVKIDSPYKQVIFFIPVLFFSVVFFMCVYKPESPITVLFARQCSEQVLIE